MCITSCKIDQQEMINFGVFTDTHYCQCESKGDRFYERSAQKLRNCIQEFNNKDLDFIISLGDLIDRDEASFNTILKILQVSSAPVYHVLGNAEFNVDRTHKQSMPQKLGLPNSYYEFSIGSWRFIILDGNDLSFHARTDTASNKYQETISLFNQVTKDNLIYAKDWNGGIGEEQLNWVRNKLEISEKKNMNVAIFCHFPVLPVTRHCLWNSDELIDLMNTFSCVKIFISGHNHEGNYWMENGIHYFTLKAMVIGENQNAFAEVSLSKGKIEIKSYGTEVNRSLKFEYRF